MGGLYLRPPISFRPAKITHPIIETINLVFKLIYYKEVTLMKTLAILKNYFIGATIGIWMIIPFCWLGDQITGCYTTFDDPELYLMLAGLNLFSCAVMYLGYHLFKGIKNDIKEITEKMKKVEKTEA
jgi:4-hydroxybenzoate polyprenyltransferase